MFIFTAFRLNLKRVVLAKSFILIMLLLPVAVLGCIGFLRQDTSVLSIKVGIVYDTRDKLSCDLIGYLEGKKEVSFEVFDNTEEGVAKLENMIKTGKLECGYIIKKDIAEQIKKGNLAELITLVKSPQTVADAAVNEMVYAAFLKAGMAEMTTAEIVKTFEGLDYDATKRLISERMAGYEEQDIYVKGDYSYRGGVLTESEDAPDAFSKRLFHGMIALFMLISAIYMLPRFVEEDKTGFYGKLGVSGTCRYYFSLFLAMFTANFVFGAASVLLINGFYPQALSGMAVEIPALMLYTAALCAIGVLVISLLNKSDWIYASSIFIIIITVSLGGIVFDIGEIVPLLAKFTNYFVTSSYINYIVNGKGKDLLILSAIFAVSFAAAICCMIMKIAKSKSP